MSKPADRPEVVQLPVESPVAVPARNRRAAAQRVREARDRLTSTSGTRPAFDHELLRQYSQTRLSASLVVMLLVVATGLLFGLWMEPLSAAAWTCLVLCLHAVIIRNCNRFLNEPSSPAGTRKWRVRFVLLDLIYGLCWTIILIHPTGVDVVSNTLMMFLMLLVVAVSSMLAASLPIAAFAATAPVTLGIAANFILRGTEVMKSEIFGAHAVPVYKDYSADIHNSGVHLLNLINEILDLSRIEAGRYELNEEAVSLVHVVADCHHLLKLRASSRGITIHEVFEQGMPRIWGDERATRQIVLNLLSNSIKFTPQGGEIWLKVGWTASGGQYLSVKDTGSGIAEDEIPIVLASFGQGSNSIKSAEQGAGLGLPIAKSLIDMHGGTFTLKSKIRIGTEVIITFPPERVMSALAPMAEEAPSLQPETSNTGTSEERHRARNKPIMSAGTGL
jgi:hypothetical protein